MRIAMLMQERRTSIGHCVISGVNFAVWTLRIHIRSRLSQSGYDPDSIWIDFVCNVDKASKHAISIDYKYH